MKNDDILINSIKSSISYMKFIEQMEKTYNFNGKRSINGQHNSNMYMNLQIHIKHLISFIIGTKTGCYIASV